MPESPTPRHTHLSSSVVAAPTNEPVADAEKLPHTHLGAAEDAGEGDDGKGATAAE